MPVKFNTEAYRALINEVRTNDFAQARETIEGWAWAFGEAHYALTGAELEGWRTSWTQAATVGRLNAGADYPEAMAWDMRAGSGEPAEVGATADDFAAAHRVMVRWAAWHSIASRQIPAVPEDATPGVAAIFAGIGEDDAAHDPYGTWGSWAFALADVVLTLHGEYLPGFRQNRARSLDEIADDNQAGMVLVDLVNDGTVTEDDMRTAYKIIDEWRDRMNEWGHSY